MNYRMVPSMATSTLRRLVYPITQMVVLFGIVLPLGLSGLALLVLDVPQVQQMFRDVETAAEHVPFVYDVLILSTVLYAGGLLLGLLVSTTVPRLLMRMLRPGETYRLYGSAYWALRTISRLTNSKFYTQTFGGQLLHRGLPAGHRLPVRQGGADRIELRHGRGARRPVPV